MQLMRILKDIACDSRGTSAVEYGLILGLIVLAMFAALAGVAKETLSMWTHVASETAKAQKAD